MMSDLGYGCLYVEVHRVEMSDEVRTAFEAEFAERAAAGLLFTPRCTVVYRSVFWPAEPPPQQQRWYSPTELSTAELLQHARVGTEAAGEEEAFAQQVQKFLGSVRESWMSHLHPSAIRLLVPIVSGALQLGELERMEGP